jgi:parallel beta-helix repeat protein
MTVSTTINRNAYTADLATYGDTYPYGFKIFSSTDLLVFVDGILQTVGYSVTSVGYGTGGNVIFEAGYIPEDGQSIVLLRRLPKTQEIDYIEGTKFPADTHEKALDRLVMMVQDVYNDLLRNIADIQEMPNLQIPILIDDPSALEESDAPYIWFNSTDSQYKGWNGFKKEYFSQPWVDVRAYGAKCDGVTDDTASFILAHAALSSGGKIILPGICLISAQIVISNNNIEIDGMGIGGFKLKDNCSVDSGSNWNWIKITGNDCKIINCIIDGNGTNQTFLYNMMSISDSSATAGLRTLIQGNIFKNGYGTCLVSWDTQDSRIIGNHFMDVTGTTGNPGEAIVGVDTIGLIITGNTFNTLTDHALYLTGGIGSGCRNISFTGNTVYRAKGCGVWIYGDVLGVTITGNIFNECRHGIGMSNKGLDLPSQITISGNIIRKTLLWASTATHGIMIAFNVSFIKTSVLISGNKIYEVGIDEVNQNSHGIVIQEADGVTIVGNRVEKSHRAGIYVHGSKNIEILGNEIKNNDQGGSGYGGIIIEVLIADGCSGILIEGNNCFDDQDVPTQQYGISVDGNTSNSLILGNYATGNAAANYLISAAATGLKIRDNIGYVSENGGTSAAIASGGTIAHGLAAAPTVYNVIPAEAGPTDWYVSADATNLTVTFSGGGNKAFRWYAAIRP